MNKKVYLSDLEWTKTHDNMGGVKANIVFNDNMTYDEYKELHDKTYYVLTDTNLEEKWNNLRNDIDKVIKTLETLKGSARWERHLYEIDYMLDTLRDNSK